MQIDKYWSADRASAWLDAAVVALLALGAVLINLWAADRLGPDILQWKSGDVWFDSDAVRVFENLTLRDSDHARTSVHPLFSLLAYYSVQAIQGLLGLAPESAVRVYNCSIASVWLGTFFLLLRAIGLQRLDALVFSLLGATSAAALFWLPLPETFPLASVTILLALLLATIAQRQRLSPAWYILVSALTLSITITNWMFGLLATAVHCSRRQFLVVQTAAVALVVCLWTVQKALFPTARFFAGGRAVQETNYLFVPEPGSLWERLQSLVFHTLIMPTIQVFWRNDQSDWAIMITQHSGVGSASVWGATAAFLWVLLLGIGLWAMFQAGENRKLCLVLGLALAGQIALHSVYGWETFLYALHFIPLLLLLACLGALTRLRPLVLTLAIALLVTCGWNNFRQFSLATTLFNQNGSASEASTAQAQRRAQLLQQVEAAPQDAGLLSAAGDAELLERNYRQAIKFYDRAIQIDNTLASAYRGRGRVNSELAYYKQALSDYDQAVRLAPRSASVQFNWAGAHFALGHHQQAIQAYRYLLTLPGSSPLAARTLFNLGQAQMMTGDRHSARNAWQKAEQLLVSDGNLKTAALVRASLQSIAP